MSAHALLSASSSKRWLTCTPSARLEATLPEPTRAPGQFDFSAEGTLAHEIAELKLKRQYDQIDESEFERLYSVSKQSKYYNEELEAYVDDYVVYVRSQIGQGDTPLFEQRVDFSEWVYDGFGTADVIILSSHKIRVIDLKFGKGVPVSAKDNSQLRLYALGAYSKFQEEFPNIKEVEYTIHQPRLDSISSDSTSLEKLLDWAKYFVKKKAQIAWAGTGEFLPGEHCQFCRAKATCRARADFNNEVAKLDFRAPPLLSDEEINLVLLKASSVKAWVTDVENYATQKAVEENIIPRGYKLTTGTTHRKLSDSAMAATVLMEKGFKEEDIFEPKSLKSVSKLEKLGQKGQVASILGDLIVRPEGAPKLVRDALIEEDFK
jgi:hypothetical protein